MHKYRPKIIDILLILSIILINVNEVTIYYELVFDILGVFLLGLFVVYKKIKYNLSIIDYLMMVVTAVLIIVTKDLQTSFVFMFYIFFSLKNDIATKRSINVILITSIICMVVIVTASLFGFNKQFNVVGRNNIFTKLDHRYALGYTHPNQVMIMFAFIVLLLMFAYPNIYVLLISLVLTICGYILTSNRTSTYIIIACIVVTLINNIYEILSKKEMPLFISRSLPYMFMFFLICTIVSSASFYDFSTKSTLIARFNINYQMLQKGITLFGINNLKYEVFDNTFLQMLIIRGAITTVFFTIVLFINTFKKKIHVINLVFYVSLFSIAFMESIFYKTNIALLIVILANYIFISKNSKGEIFNESRRVQE